MHEKALCKMRAAIPHNRPKTHSCDHFGAKLDLFEAQSERVFVTLDEYYTLESRDGTKRWVRPGESAPKRPKTQESAEKFMTIVFWDAHKVFSTDYLEKGRTITGAYYAALLDRSVNEIRKKRATFDEKKMLFLDTNMENGGFRGLLGIEKMVLCSKLCCNIANLKKHMGKVTYVPVIG